MALHPATLATAQEPQYACQGWNGHCNHIECVCIYIYIHPSMLALEPPKKNIIALTFPLCLGKQQDRRFETMPLREHSLNYIHLLNVNRTGMDFEFEFLQGMTSTLPLHSIVYTNYISQRFTLVRPLDLHIFPADSLGMRPRNNNCTMVQ